MRTALAAFLLVVLLTASASAATVEGEHRLWYSASDGVTEARAAETIIVRMDRWWVELTYTVRSLSGVVNQDIEAAVWTRWGRSDVGAGVVRELDRGTWRYWVMAAWPWEATWRAPR